MSIKVHSHNSYSCSCLWHKIRTIRSVVHLCRKSRYRGFRYHAFCLSKRFPEFSISRLNFRKRASIVFIEIMVLDLIRWTIVWNFPTTTPYTPKRWTLIDLSVGSSNAFLCLAESYIGIPFCHVCIKLLGTSVFGSVDLHRYLIQARCYWILK